jgi:aminoglycoside/choline kinase family phosphotransferase
VAKLRRETPLDVKTGETREERTKLASIVRVEYGRQPEVIEPIAAGLGTRRFYRLRFKEGQPATLIARLEAQEDNHSKPTPTEPPAWLPEPPLEPLRSFLEAAGLPVPHSYAHLPEHGLDLLEDVGDRTLTDASESACSDLYREACELVPRLQGLSAPAEDIPAFGRIFDRALVETKAWKWLHWAIPGLLEREPHAREFDAVQAAFSRISDLLDDAPRRLAHRDFKAENLHLVASDIVPGEKSEAQRLVMIDVQGAFMAPPEYDLVCLLYDLQVDLDEDFAQESFRKTLPRLPDAPDLPTARLRFDALATVRLCKDISHLVYAARVRNDVRRWHEIPRGLALLDRAAGRLGHTLPEIRELTSVIQALTAAVGSSDSSSQGRVR